MERIFRPSSSWFLMILLLLTACKGDKGDPGIQGPAGSQNESSLLFDVGEVQVILQDAFYADGTPVGGTDANDTLVVKYSLSESVLKLIPDGSYGPNLEMELVDSSLSKKVVINIGFVSGTRLDNITPGKVQSISAYVLYDVKVAPGKIKRWRGDVYFFSGGQNLTINRLAYNSTSETLSFEFAFVFDMVASDPLFGNSRGTSAVISGKVHAVEVVYRL